MAVTPFDPSKLNEAELENDPSLIGSIMAGIATGLIRIPEGAVSLGASVYDLTADTDTATEVEQWFDENIYKKLGNLEENAESTTAGKIAAALVNIGVPGGIAFRYGSKAATKAMQAAKSGNYFSLNNKTLAKAGQKALELNAKGKTLKYAAGAMAGGMAEGVFVADVENFGTIGDLLGGPTALDTESNEGGKEQALQEILNRIKFGTEGALLTGVLGGTGSLIKKVATRGKELKYSNSLTDQILNKFASGFRPRGDIPEQAFLTKREMLGKKGKDLNRAVELSRAVDRDIDRIFPNIKSTFNTTTRTEKFQLYKDLDDLLFSGKSGIDDAGRVTMGEMDSELMERIGAKLLNNGAKPEHVGNIFQNMGMMRNKWSNMATLIQSNLPLEAQPVFRNIIGDQFKQWLGRTYEVFENKSLIPFFNYKPASEAVEKVANIFMRQNRRAISRAEEAVASGRQVEIPAPLTYENALYQVNNILKNVKQDKNFTRLLKDTEATRAIRTPYFKVPTNFVKDSVADDIAKNDIFTKRLEQAATKGRYALPGPEGIPERTVIGQGSKAFRELFGEVKDVRQKMLHGTERLSMVARKGEFLQKMVDDNVSRIAAGGRGYFYGTEQAARNALGEADVVLYKGAATDEYGRALPWGETASQNPILSQFPNGAWMEKSLADALNTTEKRLINNKTAAFIYDSLVLFPKATSQFAKTVLSPVTHARNFFSAATFQTANGIWFENPKVLAAAWRDSFGALQPQMLKTNSSAGNKFYREMLELGVVNTNARYGDMSRLFGDLESTLGSGRLATDKVTKMMLKPNWAKKFAKFSQDMYVAEDDFWKMSNWIIERYRYKNAYQKAFDRGLVKNMPTRKELNEMAANITRNTVPNYEYVPEFIRSLRKFPLGNFVSFPAEILRTSTGIVQQSIKELSDPITRSIGMKRLAGFGATTAIVPAATVELFKNIYDYTEDELMALKRFLPEWSKNSTILPMRDDEGNMKYVDFSHGFAYDTITRPVQTILNKVAAGETDENTLMQGFLEGLATSTAELGSPFISEAIWTEAFLDVVRGGGKTKDGKVLYTDATPAGEKVNNIIQHLIRAVAPFSLQQLVRLGFAATGEPSRDLPFVPYPGTGQEYNLTDEALGFTGYRPVTIDPARSLDFMMSGYQRDIRDARREFNSKLLRGDPISPQDIVDRYIIANKAKWESMKKMSQDLLAGMILGTNPNDIMNVLGRISRKDSDALLKNKFIPFTISENVQKVFQDNANKLGETNPYKISEGALKGLAESMSSVPLSAEEWPDLTDIFNLEPPSQPFFNFGTQQPTSTSLDPQIYARPALTLNNDGLTTNQSALLSESEKEIQRRLNLKGNTQTV